MALCANSVQVMNRCWNKPTHLSTNRSEARRGRTNVRMRTCCTGARQVSFVCARQCFKVKRSQMCNDTFVQTFLYPTPRTMSWSQDKVLNLIEEYKSRPILWQKSDKFYYDTGRKEDAWQEISDVFDEEIAVVKKKIESLRGSRRREKNRARRSKRTYKGRTNSYTPKWFAWDALKFLDRSVSNNSEEEVIDEDPIEQVRKTNDMVNKKIVSRKRRSCPEDPRIKEPCSMLQSTVKIEDECSMFGEYIAEKLRKHDSRTRMILQHQIHNVLYEAEMNNEPIAPIKNSSL